MYLLKEETTSIYHALLPVLTLPKSKSACPFKLRSGLLGTAPVGVNGPLASNVDLKIYGVPAHMGEFANPAKIPNPSGFPSANLAVYPRIRLKKVHR